MPADIKNVYVDRFIGRSFLQFNNGFLHANKFEILFNLPKFFDRNIQSYTDNLQENVISVTVPGINLTVEDGLFERNVVKGQTKGELSLQFYESHHYRIRNMFYFWMNEAVEKRMAGGKPFTTYRRFPSELEGQLTVWPRFKKYEMDNEICDIFYGIIPVSVTGPELSFIKKDDITEITVGFKYRFHDFAHSNKNKIGSKQTSSGDWGKTNRTASSYYGGISNVETST